MQHVIVGAGPAGVVAAETLRRLDSAASITLVGDEPEPPYSRMAIPYLLSNRIDEAGTYLRKSDDHYRQLNVQVVRDKVTGIDRDAKQVTTGNGGTLAYDKLLICTGATPVVPPITGIDQPAVHPCWTLADARAIAALAKPGSKVVQIGAGFIGCIVLQHLAERGVQLRLVETEDRMVPRMMNRACADLIKRWCKQQGVDVHTSTSVSAIRPGGGGHRFTVVLNTGITLDADLVISATGVRPNIGFLQGAGLRSDAGLLVNERMQTSDPDVYAAGDVAQGRDFSTGKQAVQAIQPTAVEHGALAARNMAGQDVSSRGTMSMNVLETMGLISSSFGLWNGVPGGDSVEQCDEERFRYLSLHFDGDVLVGALSLGLTDHVGVLRGLIQAKTRLGDWKARLLDNPTRLMEAYLATTQSLSANAGRP